METEMLDQSRDDIDVSTPKWGDNAPRGGKVVLNRIIKEKATVPLFFGQTLVNSLRDMGYNTTTSALCEHVDNAIQWGASEVRVYFHQTGRKGDYHVDVLVLDDGVGMQPNVLKFATSFGGSMVYGSREGIGRYGMGMKTAALSMSPIMDLYFWQDRGMFYNMTLDVVQIGRERTNLIELPDPTLMDELPSAIADILTRPQVFPKPDEQDLFAYDVDEVTERLGKSGTLIYMPECDRLASATARPLVEHAVKEMARVYRRFLAKGLKLYINNCLVEPSDPTYAMSNARHAKIPDITVKQSKLIVSKRVKIRPYEDMKEKDDDGNEDGVDINVRLYALPIEDWGNLPLKVRKNDLHLYDDQTVSFMRNDREVHAGTIPEIAKRHSDAHWFRVQVDFNGDLDEAFGVAANKQGVRPKKYVLRKIAAALKDEITTIREHVKRHQSEQTVIRQGSRQSAAEGRADEADAFQSKPLGEPAATTEEERKSLEQNLRTLAVMLKRDKETDDEAYERIKFTKNIIHYKHDDYWPFYHVDHKFGKVILTINTAHPFYAKLYEPLSRAALAVATRAAESAAELTEESEAELQTFQGAEDALVALELMLLSLARAQSLMSLEDDGRRKLFDQFRTEWSNTYQVQLMQLSAS
jgi:hypothetical protein